MKCDGIKSLHGTHIILNFTFYKAYEYLHSTRTKEDTSTETNDHACICPFCLEESLEESEENSLECNSCRDWSHFQCNGLSTHEFKEHCDNEDLDCLCMNCQQLELDETRREKKAHHLALAEIQGNLPGLQSQDERIMAITKPATTSAGCPLIGA